MYIGCCNTFMKNLLITISSDFLLIITQIFPFSYKSIQKSRM